MGKCSRKDVARFRQVSDDTMQHFRAAESVPAIAGAGLPSAARVVEHGREALETTGIRERVVDFLQNALVIPKDFLPWPQCIEVQTRGALIRSEERRVGQECRS